MVNKMNVNYLRTKPLLVPWDKIGTMTEEFGDRSFVVAGPRVWNCLPAALRAVEDYERFKRLLKHLFD